MEFPVTLRKFTDVDHSAEFTPNWIPVNQVPLMEWLNQAQGDVFLDLRTAHHKDFFHTLPVRGWLQSSEHVPPAYFPHRQPSARKGNGPLHLFVHGFTGDPVNWCNFERAFRNSEWPFMNMLLPGHGRPRSAFAHSTHKEWRRVLRQCVQQLESSTGPRIGWGLSMGGSLLIGNHTCFDALVVINSPWKIHDWRAPLLPILKRFMPYHFSEESGKVTPVSSIIELRKVLKETRDRAPRVNLPVLIINHEDDEVVPPRDGKKFAKILPNVERITFSSGGHESPANSTVAPELLNQICDWLESLPFDFPQNRPEITTE